MNIQSLHQDPKIKNSKRTKELIGRFAVLDRKTLKRLMTKGLTSNDRKTINKVIEDSRCYACDCSRINGGYVSDRYEDEL